MKTYNLGNCNLSTAVKKSIKDYFGNVDVINPEDRNWNRVFVFFRDARPQIAINVTSKELKGAFARINTKEGSYYLYKA